MQQFMVYSHYDKITEEVILDNLGALVFENCLYSAMLTKNEDGPCDN